MSTAELGRVMPVKVTAVPASESVGRGRDLAVRARRIRPMSASSAPVRSHHRIRLMREGRAAHWTPCRGAGRVEIHKTTVCPRDRRPTAASRTR